VADILSDHVLTLATAIGTFLAAIAAWGSAFLSKQANQVAAHAAQAAADAAQATLYRSLQQEYASREIHDAMRRLSEWYWRFEDRGLDFASEWKERWETEPEVRWLNEARRRVSHFFGTIADLYNGGLLSEPVARRLANFSGDLVFVVVEPLEKELGDPRYNKLQFDILADLTGYSGPRA
jgi:hypothetical protein